MVRKTKRTYGPNGILIRLLFVFILDPFLFYNMPIKAVQRLISPSLLLLLLGLSPPPHCCCCYWHCYPPHYSYCRWISHPHHSLQDLFDYRLHGLLLLVQPSSSSPPLLFPLFLIRRFNRIHLAGIFDFFLYRLLEVNVARWWMPELRTRLSPEW